MFQWNWASFGSGITTVILCLALCLLLCFFLRKNNRANSRARRSEVLTGRGHHVSTRQQCQSGIYPPSSGYPGTAFGHSGRGNEPPPPYSAVAQTASSCPSTSAPAIPVSTGFLGVTYNPATGVTLHSGVPQLGWQNGPSVSSVPGGAAFSGAASMPALAGPQLQLVAYPGQPLSLQSPSGNWSSRIREVSPVRSQFREVSPVRSRVTYVDMPRERDLPPPIIRTPRVDRRSVGTGVSRSGSVRSVRSETSETGIRGFVNRSSEGFEED